MSLLHTYFVHGWRSAGKAVGWACPQRLATFPETLIRGDIIEDTDHGKVGLTTPGEKEQCFNPCVACLLPLPMPWRVLTRLKPTSAMHTAQIWAM